MTLPRCDERWRQAQRYQPFFCEENVWQLLRAPDLPEPRAAVFVSNAARSVAVWGQRAADEDPIVWDYHVVLLLPRERLVIDLDDRERCDRPVAAWLAHAFRSVEPEYRPGFRVVDGAQFLATFSSDRSHMRDRAGRQKAPFPPWPAPFDPARGMNLMRFVDFADPIAGVVTDGPGLLRSVGG